MVFDGDLPTGTFTPQIHAYAGRTQSVAFDVFKLWLRLHLKPQMNRALGFHGVEIEESHNIYIHSSFFFE